MILSTTNNKIKQNASVLAVAIPHFLRVKPKKRNLKKMMHKTKEIADQYLAVMKCAGYDGIVVRWTHATNDRTLIRYDVKITSKPQETK